MERISDGLAPTVCSLLHLNLGFAPVFFSRMRDAEAFLFPFVNSLHCILHALFSWRDPPPKLHKIWWIFAFIAFSRIRINFQAHFGRSTPINPTRAPKPGKAWLDKKRFQSETTGEDAGHLHLERPPDETVSHVSKTRLTASVVFEYRLG
jgi:hypothetical protein